VVCCIHCRLNEINHKKAGFKRRAYKTGYLCFIGIDELIDNNNYSNCSEKLALQKEFY